MERGVEHRDLRARPRTAPPPPRRPRGPPRCAAARARSPTRTAALTSSVSGAGACRRGPPWTIRCPTASTSSGSSRSSARAAAPRSPGSRSTAPAHTGAPGTASAAPGSTSYSAAFSELDPALSASALTRRPCPLEHLGHVDPVLVHVLLVLDVLVAHRVPHVDRAVPEPRHAVDRVADEAEAVDLVQHAHVERRRGRALLLVAAHVEVARGSCAGRSAGGSATGSRGRRTRSACRA